MRSDRYLGGHCWPARGVSSDEAPLITKSTRPPQCLNCGERGLRESAPRRKPKDTAVQSEFTRRTKVRNQGGQLAHITQLAIAFPIRLKSGPQDAKPPSQTGGSVPKTWYATLTSGSSWDHL